MDNSPEAVKGRVRSMTKAIRYKARKEGNLMKAFNDYMGSQSGISATERSAVKSSLGLSENKWRTPKSDWRSEINEVVDGETNEKTIKEKKVKNKIVINPTIGMKEAIEALGGEIVEMVEEVEVDESMSPKEIQLQKRRSQIDMQIARDRRREVAKASTDKNKEAPTRAMGEGYGMGEIDQKVGAVTPIPKKEQDAAKARLLAKAKAKREARMKEGLDKETKKSMDEFFRKAFNAKIPHSLQEDEVDEMYKGKHGQSEKEYQRGRSPAGKMISGDDKMSGAKYTHGSRVSDGGAGPQPAGGSKKPKAQGRMDSGSRADLQYRKANLMRKEETEASLRDRRMERGGVDGNVDYRRPPKNNNTEFGKKKPSKMRAVDKVRDDIIKRYGKGALIDTKKK